jgi:hypothetical protein
MLPPGLRSQQAGTILPTLMLSPPVMPPRGWCFPVSDSGSRKYDKEFFFHETSSWQSIQRNHPRKAQPAPNLKEVQRAQLL